MKVNDRVTILVVADLEDEIHLINTMFNKIEEGYDIVCESRYMKGGKQVVRILFKKFLLRLAGISLHYIINIPTHDVTNSFKMYSKQLLNSITIESNGGFELGMEITIKAYINNYLITELPTTWRDRSSGGSRFKLFKWLPKYIYWYLYGFIKHISNNS